MKQTVLDFIRRGLTACGIGPLVLAVLYLIKEDQTGVTVLTINEVCLGIFSLSALAFIAGGMNVVYRIERLPLAVAIALHGGVLYVSYLITYLLNNWLERSLTPILIFSGIFIVSYLCIWAAIYAVTKRNAEDLNSKLKEKQQRS